MDEGRNPASGRLQPGHERTDLDAKRVALVGIVILGVLGLAAHAGSFLLFKYLAVREGGPGLSAPPDLPPVPRLQTNTTTDIEALRAKGTAQLHGYGWVDRGSGIARIPIERAMDLVADRLPVLPPTTGGAGAAASSPGAISARPGGPAEKGRP